METEIHAFSQRMGKNNCYLIREDGIMIVDSGTPKHGRIFPKWLEKLSVDPEDISLLFLTHGHVDHIGSANTIKKLTGCKVAINYREKDWVEKAYVSVPPGVNLWGRMSAATGRLIVPFIRFPGTPIDWVLEDQEYSLEPYGINGKIYHTPGHTSGSMSLLLDSGDAFVGDLAVNGLPMRFGPGMPQLAEDTDAVKNSWRLLLTKGAKYIYPTHGKGFSADILEKLLQ